MGAMIPCRFLIVDGGRAGTRTPDLLRVKPDPGFFWFYDFHSVLCLFNVKLSPEAAPLYRAASLQYRKLKTLLEIGRASCRERV